MTPFIVDAMRREALLHGLDDIGLTLKDDELIRAWQLEERQRHPWVWPSPQGATFPLRAKPG